MQPVYAQSMSTSSSTDVSRVIEGARPADVTPVTLEADALESTAPPYLDDLKRELDREGLYPARLSVDACFDENCSLDTQAESDRIRDYVRAAAYLGAGTIVVGCREVADPEKVRPALAACRERAARDGIDFHLDGPTELDDHSP